MRHPEMTPARLRLLFCATIAVQTALLCLTYGPAFGAVAAVAVREARALIAHGWTREHATLAAAALGAGGSALVAPLTGRWLYRPLWYRACVPLCLRLAGLPPYSDVLHRQPPG